jgi:hypothetical protein
MGKATVKVLSCEGAKAVVVDVDRAEQRTADEDGGDEHH